MRAFYVGHITEKDESEMTGKTVRRQHQFRLSSAKAFLLAAVRKGDRFSLVTASVAPIHDHMPPVLGSRELNV